MQNEKENFKKNFIKRLISFSVDVIKFSVLVRASQSLRPIVDQLVRSATSVGANVVEAKSSSSKKDYIKFFEIALKSANETKFWFIIIRESDHKLALQAGQLLSEAEEIANIIGASVLTLKGKK